MQRIHSLDVARGVAVMSMAYVHFLWFAHPSEWMGDLFGAESWLFALGRVLIHGKVTSLFALIFGYGLALQVASFERRGSPVRRLLLLRLGWIGAIGAVHGFLIWHGDILLVYAISGLVIVLAYRLQVRELLFLAGVFLGFCWLLSVPTALWLTWAPPVPGVFASGNWLYIVVVRIALFARDVISPVNLYVLASIVGGYALGRFGLHGRIRFARGLALVLLPLWLVVSGLGIIYQFDGVASAWWIVYLLGAPIGGLMYVSLLFWLGNRPMPLLEAYGRMSLSNYLAQSLMLVVIFYGLQLYGQVSIVAAFVLALLVVIAQLAVSFYLFERFGVGPIEGWLKTRLMNQKQKVTGVGIETFGS